ncbi:60S acidic ribosomal protein P2 [Spizellomyces punctatus DAOM BR117]|uniref:60S acidic ribosomal protein P2 n=1 Tax=Spizellomyces punctatus (strain DAOM BR117) TaxID=645134 RepID=A0A0L0HTW5_SPIPD|nr:60S acidic ribosomal protein P2 [Spizellomyces punctatus DAOM BR117]KND04345.1 60S acidic ribosomal protein P2 [Spizellomyces punctatus DAOM BR117]|eukprot:XP_016612384.1 60S acidic ribosomal protein P2 [Spizellomyces punctatus DAOM BR117]
MKHLAAYLLATLGGNATPSAADIKKILGAVGVEAEEERISKLLAELNGKDINELIAEGSKKLSSLPAGGASAAAGASGAAAAGGAAEAPKEEKKEEAKEESDDDMGFGLFD